MSAASPKTVIVTGAATGIGEATARRFADGRHRLALLDRDRERGSALERELREQGHAAHFYPLDVTDADAVERALGSIADTLGGIDVLINNAGIIRDAQLVKWKDGEVQSTLSDADFDAVIDVNLRAVFRVTRGVVPFLLARGGGVILSASSIVAQHGNFGQTSYAAAKAGIVAMTQTWARELGRHGIRVNAVAPGFIETEMFRSIPAGLRAQLHERPSLRRLGRPEEVAEAYYWLASPAASYVTGAVLPIDGGLVLGT